jgi:hypothetical protein
MGTPPVQSTTEQELDLLLARELLGAGGAEVAALLDPVGLHICPECRLPFVAPGEIREVVGADRVRLDLVCTNCDWATTAVHDETELAALDVQTDRAFADLLWTLEVVWIANEESAIARFTAALQAGAIIPEDF